MQGGGKKVCRKSIKIKTRMRLIKSTKNCCRGFEEIIEKDRKDEERLKAGRMAKAIRMVD